MLRYLGRTLLFVIPTIIGVSFVIFSAVRLIPGDPAVAIAGEHATPALVAQVRKELGLDQPLLTQYARFMAAAARGDLGKSIRTGLPVAEELLRRLPRTLTLATTSLVCAAVVGILAGIISATRPYSVFDSASMVLALIGVSMPVFWLGLMLMLLFAILLPRWLGLGAPVLPPTGAGTWRHLVMPTLTLAANSTAIIARMTRSSMLEVVRQDYIRTARAKGLAERVVVYRHALKNALIPVVTVLGLQFGTLLGGAVLTETVFAWPGIGRLLMDSISYRDYPTVQGAVLVVAVGFILVNVVVDVIYALLDPRIRYM
jgi:ABC-type dipeptide/oligopeptide/nickel transport system permease component